MAQVLVDSQASGVLTDDSLAYLQSFVNQWFPGGSLKTLSIYKQGDKYVFVAGGYSVKDLSTLTSETRIVGTVDEQGNAHPF